MKVQGATGSTIGFRMGVTGAAQRNEPLGSCCATAGPCSTLKCPPSSVPSRKVRGVMVGCPAALESLGVAAQLLVRPIVGRQAGARSHQWDLQCR